MLPKLIIYLLGLLGCYGLASFVALDIHPSTWGWGGRVGALLLALAWSAAFGQAVAEPEFDEE